MSVHHLKFSVYLPKITYITETRGETFTTNSFASNIFSSIQRLGFLTQMIYMNDSLGVAEKIINT